MNKLLIGALFISTSLFAEVEAPLKLSFLLPINWMGSEQINLSVSIPENFVAIQPPETWVQSSIVEFIPKGEDENNWSEIITIHKFLGTQISATAFSAKLKDYMIAQSTNSNVLKIDDSTEDSYQRALLGLAYDYNGKHEVIGSLYYSGPADCVGVQYTIRPEKGMSDETAFAKIESFLKDNTEVITSE